MNVMKRDHGAVTIFLVLILVPVIVVCTIFIDVSRIQLAKGLAASSGDLSLNTVLTQYDKDLADYYGLMASCQSIEEFYDTAENYFVACMVSQGVRTLDSEEWAHSIGEIFLEDATINDFICIDTGETSAEITAAENGDLANPAMMKEQIMDFMKYRAPIELVSGMDGSDGPDGMVTKLLDVEEGIEVMPAETEVQNKKTKYYQAENELLQKSLEVYETLVEYEALGLDQTYMADTLTRMEQLEQDYEELHKDYVSNWCNTDGYGKVQSVATQTSGLATTMSGDNISASTLRGKVEDCFDRYDAYITAKNKVQEKVEEADFRNKPDTEVNHVQYWVQMAKILGNTYQDYVDALKALRVAYLDMVYAYENRDTEDKPTGDYDPETSEPVYEEYDAADESYSGYDNIKAAYDAIEPDARSGWNTRQSCAIYGISARLERYSTEAIDKQVTDRESAGTRIKGAVQLPAATEDLSAEKLKERYERITKGREILEKLTRTGSFGSDGMLGDLIELTDRYDSTYQDWKRSVEKYDEYADTSDIIDTSKKEIAIIDGEGDEEKGLVRVDIDSDDIRELRTRMLAAQSMIDSYRKSMESIRYHGTTIIGDKVITADGVRTFTNDDGINTFAAFDAAAKAKKGDGEYSAVSASEIPVLQTELDAYISRTWYIEDQIAELIEEVTADNKPEMEDAAGNRLPFVEWLHQKFDGKELDSRATRGMLDALKETMKGLAEGFDTYDNSAYISDNQISGESDLPSGGATGSSLEVADSNEDDDDEVTENLGDSNAVSGLFGNIDFAGLLTSGRDNLYTTVYIVNMFSYDTYHLEGIYDMAREQAGRPSDNIYSVSMNGGTSTIKPGNAEELYDPMMTSRDSGWRDEDTAFTQNKSLTNKMINMTSEDLGIVGNNWSYGNEVEYILYGGDTESSKEKLSTVMFFTRYAMNIAPVFTKYWNDDEIVGPIASGISSATGGIIPIPLVKLVICLGVCAAETAVDMNYLKAGLPVLFKKDTDYLFIELSIDKDAFCETIKTGSRYEGEMFSLKDKAIPASETSFSYSDYLNMFLFISLCAGDEAGIYARTADVIQTNQEHNGNIEGYGEDGFLMSRAKTYFTLSADRVRVKPMMVALPYGQQNGTEALLDTDTWNTFSYKGSRGY